MPCSWHPQSAEWLEEGRPIMKILEKRFLIETLIEMTVFLGRWSFPNRELGT